MSPNTKFHCDRPQDSEKVGLYLFGACLEGVMTSSLMVYRCFVINFSVTHELIAMISPFMPNFGVRSHETSKLYLKMCFDACSENDIIDDGIILGLEWQNIQNTEISYY